MSLIVHDFDYPLYSRKTCLRRAFWLILYAIFGWSKRFRSKIPHWLMYEKYSQALALAMINKMLGIDSVFALTDEVRDRFPDLADKLKTLNFKVVRHWHVKYPRKGFRYEGRGAWEDVIDFRKHYMNYDRHYVLENKRELPEEGTSVPWHVDHMSYNLPYYLEFLQRMGMSPIVNIHPSVKIGKDVTYHPPIYIGRNTIIGDHVRIGKFAHIGKEVEISSNVIIEGMVYISPKTIIENDVFISPMACILNDKYPPSGRLRGVRIERGAVIGANSTLLAGITVGTNSVIGAGSVVTDDVPSNVVMYGNPAKIRMTTEEYKKKQAVWRRK